MTTGGVVKKKKMSSSMQQKPPLKGVGPNPGDPEDVEAFLASLNPRHKTCPPWVARELIRLRATRCITALLEHHIPHNKIGLIVKLKDEEEEDEDEKKKPSEKYIYPMCYASQHGFHDGIRLFMDHTHCRRPGIRALEAAFRAIHKAAGGAPHGYTLSDLILSLPQWISHNFNWWHTVKLLGRVMPALELRQRIRKYANDGEALKLLLVLLAAPDLVLSPGFTGSRCYLHDLLAARL